MHSAATSHRPAWRSPWPWLTWLAGAALMVALDGTLDIANLGVLLMLTAAVSSLWLPALLSAGASAVAIVAFNWSFVPPRHTFSVDLQQHAVLMAAMLAVNWIIAGLMHRQRRLADTARHMARSEARLRAWGDTLRDAADPAAQASALHAALAEAAQAPVVVAVAPTLDAGRLERPLLLPDTCGEPQRSGLAQCMRDGHALGAGTGRYTELPDWYLPLRGPGSTLGAVWVGPSDARGSRPELRAQLQALCDQMGGALHRSFIAAREQRAQAEAQLQATRNALLAAISHDYRTPLATILGAATALHDQAGRLDPAQSRRLAHGIVEEAERLRRLTDNTLQLARLDAPSVQLRCDWESAEEIVGAVMRRMRQQAGGHRIRCTLPPGLPLLWCNGMLVSQLLENLLDNALRYGPPDKPVDLWVALLADAADPHWALRVCDQGPGIAPGWRDKVFDVFQRGDPDSPAHAHERGRQGTGVGLAVCRAIARAHGGDLQLLPAGAGGCCVQCVLPGRDVPAPPGEIGATRDVPAPAVEIGAPPGVAR